MSCSLRRGADQDAQLLLAQHREVVELVDGLLRLGLLRHHAEQIGLRHPLRVGERLHLLERGVDLRELALGDQLLQARAHPLVVREPRVLPGGRRRGQLVLPGRDLGLFRSVDQLGIA